MGELVSVLVHWIILAERVERNLDARLADGKLDGRHCLTNKLEV